MLGCQRCQMPHCCLAAPYLLGPQVDLVLSGHVHAYARTCNVLDERCVAPRTAA